MFFSSLKAFLPVAGLIASTTVLADPADVVKVEVMSHGDDRYTFSVTVKHNDTGWEHYADAWVIFIEDGQNLAARNLQHPHVDEQPFTRSLPYVYVPADIKTVIIRAHCSRDKFGGKEITVMIPADDIDPS